MSVRSMVLSSPGMFHCYQSMYKILPESREGFDAIVELLK